MRLARKPYRYFRKILNRYIYNDHSTFQHSENYAFYVASIQKFFTNLQEAFRHLDGSVNDSIQEAMGQKLFLLLDIHVGHYMFENILKKIARRKKSGHFQKKTIAKQCLPLIAQCDVDDFNIIAKEIVNIKFQQLEAALLDTRQFNEVKGKKCSLINALFTPTWAPTFKALREKEWKCAGIFRCDIKEAKAYSVMRSDQIPMNYLYFHDIFGTLIFLLKAENYPILLSGEAFHFSNWDAEHTIILYAIMSAFAKSITVCQETIRNHLFYLMYDGLKPVSNDAIHSDKLLSLFYKDYLQSANKIIYNSNRESFGEFVENAYGVNTERLHFFRYSERPKNPKPRLSFGHHQDDFHVVCITACIDSSLDGLRMGVADLVRAILHQGIHFHYYNGDPDKTITDFIKTIDPKFKDFFHSYPVIHDQETLVNELHQYHLGLNPSDHLLMSDAISRLSDRRYQDASRRFIQSTCPTSNLAYVAAGLPVISTLDADNLLYDTMFSLTYSEFFNLKHFLIKMNLPECCKKAENIKENAWVETHIHKLIDFMNYSSS